MRKSEAQWNITLNKYLREKKIHCYYELKNTELEYFSFARIEQCQYDGLQASEKNGFVWKLSDMDIREKPFDGFSTPPLPSYLIIHFMDGFYFIRIKTIVDMRESGMIAITKEIANNVAERIVRL